MIMIIMIVKSPNAVPKIMAIPTFDSEKKTEFTTQFLCIISKVHCVCEKPLPTEKDISTFYNQIRKPDSYKIAINSNDLYINDKCDGQYTNRIYIQFRSIRVKTCVW